MTEQSKALTVPSSLEEVSGLAKAFVASGMFSDTKQLSQAIVKIQAGRELGLPPVYSMQNINLIRDRLTRDRLTCSANTMAMLVKTSGRYNYHIKEHNDLSCSITFYELDGGKWVDVGISTFTMDDAKRAGIIKPGGGWEKYPRAMLFSRAISQGARMYAPDAIGGVYTDEEIRSIPSMPKEPEAIDIAKAGAKALVPPTEAKTAQTEQDIKDGWPPDPPNAARAAAEQDEQTTPDGVIQPDAIDPVIIEISQAEEFPSPKPGQQIRIRESGNCYIYMALEEGGGRWFQVPNPTVLVNPFAYP